MFFSRGTLLPGNTIHNEKENGLFKVSFSLILALGSSYVAMLHPILFQMQTLTKISKQLVLLPVEDLHRQQTKVIFFFLPIQLISI